MRAGEAVSRWGTEPSPASGVTSRVVARRQPEPWDAPRLGRFEIVRTLGAGGMGAVFEVIDRERGTRLALKLLQRERPSLRIRFKGEFRALAGIVHPNVVRVDQLLEENEALYFTMELLHGVHFLQHVRLSGARFDEARLRAALPQLARGLAAIHRAGRVHRDVKPANVLVTPEGRVVVLDLGLALDVGRGEQEARRVGTATFMAPEQAAARSAGPPADWYSVGVLLHVSLTGTLPSEPGSSLVPRIHAPGLPRDLTTLCARLLSRDPALRPTGAEVLHALGAGDDAGHDGGRPPMPPGPAGAHASAPPPALAGRERELGVLDSAFAEVLGGKPAAVIVAGARGTGKSALLSRFLNLVKDDAIVLSGRCDSREQLRYQAVDEILDGLSRHLARLPREELREISPPDAALLGMAFPALRAAGPPPLGEVRPHTVPRARIVAALRTLLHRLSTLRPLVLAVDDLHRADPESSALLAEILRPPDAPALLFLATTRPDEPACAPAWPARHVTLAAT